MTRHPSVHEPSARPATTFRLRTLAVPLEPAMVHDILRAIFAALDPDQEHVVVLALDHAGELRGLGVVASGARDHVFVDPRAVLRHALVLGAAAIILAHNHPSGGPEPSAADRTLTADLVATARCLGIEVNDHVVVSRRGNASLRAQCPELFARRPAEDPA